jgi:hypothetical protein
MKIYMAHKGGPLAVMMRGSNLMSMTKGMITNSIMMRTNRVIIILGETWLTDSNRTITIMDK